MIYHNILPNKYFSINFQRSSSNGAQHLLSFISVLFYSLLSFLFILYIYSFYLFIYFAVVSADAEWSAWSQCSVTCGRGVQIRSKSPALTSHAQPVSDPSCYQMSTQTKECFITPFCRGTY